MEDAIYLVQSNKSLVEMTVEPYESEPLLQELLAKYPHLLGGGQMNQDNPRRWLLIAREMGIPWEEGGGNKLSLDHLFLDQDGIPTLVEVKRSSDTRIRREVVGQMFEYAANAVVYWPVEKIKAQYELRCERENLDPDYELAIFLTDMDEEDEEAGQEQFWQQVHTNLQAGRIRMVFVADEIPFQLRRIVEFLNEQLSTAEVLAVEVKQYVGQGLQTLVPRIIGQTTQTQAKTTAQLESRQWNEESFFEMLAKRKGSTEVQIAKRVLEWAKLKMSEISWGKGKQHGSFVPGFTHNGQRYQLIRVATNGYIELQFKYIKAHNYFNDAQRLTLLKRVNQTVGTTHSDENIHKRPSFSLDKFAQPDILDTFLQDLEWALDEIKRGRGSDTK